jgi:DNA-binding HxlR family transcriptional regulator
MYDGGVNHEDPGPGATDVIERLGAFADRDDWSSTGWCRIERALEVIGTRSAMLIVRELLYGGTKFDELVRRTGMSEAVVASRLKQLHADEIVERRPYRESGQRTRDEYVLTDRGRRLFPIVVALMEWGDLLRDDASSGVELIHRGCGSRLAANVQCGDGHDVHLTGAAVRMKDERAARAYKQRAVR